MKAMALLVALLVAPTLAGADLPLVEDAAFEPLREHGRQLVAALAAAGQPLPAQAVKAIQTLLDAPPHDPQQAARRLQQLLDPYCLLGVSINPESRVKAARGPQAAELVRGQPTLVLIKIHNDGGVTHRLAVAGAGIAPPGKAGPDRWLEAAVAAQGPLDDRLSGQRLEYKVLRLTAREAGKREATFQLDVGQGTQDLGFRAEVPVLFTVRQP
jgi:hypothetical protein